MSTAGVTIFAVTIGAITTAYLIKRNGQKIKNRERELIFIEEEMQYYECDPLYGYDVYDIFYSPYQQYEIAQTTMSGNVKSNF
jgi:hypothetical protein